jgi:hydrogenase expression/formation protein HypE
LHTTSLKYFLVTGVGDFSQILPVGKIPARLLEQLLRQLQQSDGRIILRPGIGVDAAVAEINGDLLAMKVDPITFATDEIGWYAVHVNANDIAMVGGQPAWFLAALLLPERRTTAELVEDIFGQMVRACSEVGALLVGGHTEITHSLDRPIVAGCMLGNLSPHELVHPGLIEAGDELVVARGAAIEATALLAREFALEVEQHFGEDYARRCRRFLHDPGISVVRAARVALSTGWVHAMHDPTEGGLLTGLWEMAEASCLGLEIDLDRVLVYPETEALCKYFGLDPFGVIASGSLLLAAKAGKGASLAELLERQQIPASVVGLFTSKPARLVVRQGKAIELAPLPRDEITKLFEGT